MPSLVSFPLIPIPPSHPSRSCHSPVFKLLGHFSLLFPTFLIVYYISSKKENVLLFGYHFS